MEQRFKIRGIAVELIKSFRDEVLVQTIETREIFLAPYWAIDVQEDTTYTQDESNIISLEGWKQWQERKKTLKQLEQNLRKKPVLQPKSNQKMGKLIALK